MSIVWGCFAVPNDPSRSGQTIVPINGLLRLAIEIIIFGIGAWFLYRSNLMVVSWFFALTVIVHYIISYDRISWLIQQ